MTVRADAFVEIFHRRPPSAVYKDWLTGLRTVDHRRHLFAADIVVVVIDVAVIVVAVEV